MSGIAARKCVRHVAREAVARCPACSEHYCRECVVEHAGRLLCAACLAKEAAIPTAVRRTIWPKVSAALLSIGAGLVLWIVFYAFGQLLKAIPARLHEGTVWRTNDS